MTYPWLQNHWQRLGEALASERMPHAVMLAGPAGIGKSNFATKLAERVLCQAEPGQQPCGHCRSCQLFVSGHHPDLLAVQREEGSKLLKVDQIRALGDFLANKSHVEGGYKVVVLNPAEAMNVNAANALLKNLEEPAGKSLLILVSHQASAVMATIRSRCQLVSMAKPDQEQALQWLAASLDSAERAQELLALAGGAPLSALSLLSGNTLEELQELLQDLSGLLQGQQQPLAVAATWSRREMATVLDCLMQWVPVWAASLAGRQVLPVGDVLHCLRAEHLAGLLSFYDQVKTLKQQLAKGGNPNKQLALESLLFSWAGLRTGSCANLL